MSTVHTAELVRRLRAAIHLFTARHADREAADAVMDRWFAWHYRQN